MEEGQHALLRVLCAVSPEGTSKGRVKMSLTIVVADDHELIRKSVGALLSHESDFEVLAECGNPRQVLRIAKRRQPAVAILDVTLGGEDAIKTTRRIKALSPATRVIVLSAYVDEHSLSDLIEAGIGGFVLRSDPVADLIQAIRCSGNEVYLSSDVGILVKKAEVSNGRFHGSRSTTNSLSPRQREVLRLIAEGYSSKSIAGKFGVSPSTVKSHRKNLMEKLNIHDKVGLTHYAIRIGLIRPK